MKVVKIRPDDVIVAVVDCGNLPPRRTMKRLQSISKSLKDCFSNKSIMIASSGAHDWDHPVEGVNLTIVRKVSH